ncbi:uncharacterized protein BCR38DRAFT_301941, partial [Pseudomassariella vexata]
SPLVLSPALPSELLTYVLNYHVHPTTLVICSLRSDFLASLLEDIRHHTSSEHHEDEAAAQRMDATPEIQAARVGQTLLSSPIYQVAIARHIRTVYVPTVTHLRAYLAVFSSQTSRISAPPSTFNVSHRRPPHLVIYGMLNMHRDTSEWSAQGLGDTSAVLVETGHRLGWQVAVIEPWKHGDRAGLEDLLKEKLPILSGGARRLGLDTEERGWSGRTVEVGRVLGRWFQFRRGDWD